MRPCVRACMIVSCVRVCAYLHEAATARSRPSLRSALWHPSDHRCDITGVIRFLPAAQERTGCLPDYTRHCAQSPVPPLDGTSREARIYGHGKVRSVRRHINARAWRARAGWPIDGPARAARARMRACGCV